MASFMLALIGLKKFRSFQKPNRIDVLEKKTRRLGAGPGVVGSVAESQESGARLQSRVGGPEAKSHGVEERITRRVAVEIVAPGMEGVRSVTSFRSM